MTTTTPDMGLILPDVSVTAGPQWATLLNAAFSTVDSHNHATGNGVQITPSGLNINSDLTFVQNNATNLRSLRLFNNSSFTPGVSDLTCLYSLNNELYYRDGAGNIIQFTLGGFLDISANINTLTIKDTSFFIENFSDTTKQMRFNVSAIPTSTTRILSVPDSGGNDTFVTQAATQTLTNKTLTGNTAVNLVSGAGQVTLNTSGTVTLPNATDTLVGKTTTDTLTNKVLTGNTAVSLISGSGTLTLNTTGTVTLPNATDTLVGKATTDILSNKSVTGPLKMLAATAVQFNNSANTFSTSLIAGSNAANLTLTLPIVDGSSTQVLQTNGSGVLSFVTPPGTSQATATVLGTVKGGTVPGDISGSNIAAGYIGEQLISTVTSGSVGAANAYANATSLTLSAGRWNITLSTTINSNTATATGAYIDTGISTTSTANSFPDTSSGVNETANAFTNLASNNIYTSIVVPDYNVHVSTSTTYYAKVLVSAYSVATPTYYNVSLKATRVG